MWFMKDLSLSGVLNHGPVEALLMRWLKRDLRKVGLALVGLLFFLVVMLWIPVSAAAYEGTSGLVTPTPATAQETPTVHPTPTVDATVTALQKEQLLSKSGN